ncbi:MAG TPA: DUF3320 domain-containing protein, partial [Planctomycetota bacterium]|nr:DUF3320 domain-containing protein [Planctomycetota bacterium]
LDLSLRNRLINFRPSKATLRLLHDDLAALEDAIADGGDFVVRAVAQDLDRRAGEPLDEARARRAAFLAGELARHRLCVAGAQEDVDDRLLELWRQVRLAREETGAEILFLALGTLRWYETPSSSDVRCAPLVLVPLAIERISAREGFVVRAGDEEPRVNVTLLEKLAVEFGIDVTGLDELGQDEHGIDLAGVLQRFRRAVRDVDRWDVVEEAWIAPFSFAKFLLWRDLVAHRDLLLDSPVLRHLVESPDRPFEPDARFPDPSELDEAFPAAATFCPLEADSSQLAAVLAAAQGRSFVLEGPPGTGKSQTITNLIAQCVAAGKRVLFVAEKMAALEVVRQRLEHVGLGPFCLELHRKESSKRAVLASLQRALAAAAAHEPEEWERTARDLEAARADLNAYVAAIHAPRPAGESVFTATAELIRLRGAPRVPVAPAAGPAAIDVPWVAEGREAADALRAAALDLGDVAAHPLRAVRRGRFETALPDRTAAVVDAASAALDELRAAAVAAGEVLFAPLFSLGRTAFTAALDLAEALPATPGANDALLTEPGFADLRSRLSAAIEAVRQKDLLRDRVREAFADRVLTRDLATLLRDLRAGMASVWPLSWWRCGKVRRALVADAKGGHLGANEVLAQRLEDAIDLQGRIAALADPTHVGAHVFGQHLWNAGDPGREGVVALTGALAWAERVRDAVRTLQDALREPAGAALHQRVVELAGRGRDALAPGAAAGECLRRFAAAGAHLVDCLREVDALLDVDAELAWTEPQGTAWLDHCGATLQGIAAAREALPAWCHWRRVRERAVAHGLGALVEGLEHGTLAAHDVVPAFERGFREAWLAAVADAEPLLREFTGRAHERRIRQFAELDRTSLDLARRAAIARLSARVPRGSGEPAASSELGILRRELAKKARHKPLRRLFAEIPNLLPRLKPCFLMSPLSVAQYLAPGGAPFDLVVFDEASQIPVSDAVGALARGRAAVVVGDSRQLPPTTFFQRLEQGEQDLDDVPLDELESILDECRSAGLRALRLQWHYRSRHESLIAFSNWHYYDNSLLTFPAPATATRDLGVSLVRVDGVYDRSRSRTNRAEAESLVRDLLGRLRAPTGDGRPPSIGVVTFSQAQQALIERLLDEERRRDPTLEPAFAEDADEPVFVKNLENVQGDERDVILFSVGYGPDANGRVAMSFGPLNAPGGERRLNVAITRARRQVVVHATLRAEQIDLSRTSALGVAHLKAFLAYAERGPAALGEALALPGDAARPCPFADDLGAALAARGFTVARQVGCSGYRVELAVEDPDAPGRFLLGIETDGPFYRAAATARDRDRLRRAVLEQLGWRLARAWSTDWWRSRERELTRLCDAIAAARVGPAELPPPPGADAAPAASVAAQADGETSTAAPAPSDETTYVPVRAERRDRTFDAASDAELAEAVAAVLASEAPLHEELLARRMAAFFELPRVTARVRARVLAVARGLPEATRPVERGAFLWPAGVDPESWSAFRVPRAGDEGSQRDPAHIPPEEIAAAVAHVVARDAGIAREDAIRATAVLFGFGRVGPRLHAAIDAGVEMALARGKVRALDGWLTTA